MHPDQWLSFLLYTFESISFSSWTSPYSQKPILDLSPPEHAAHAGGPVFSPPNGPDDFFCDYSAMGSQWRQCSTSDDRSCWLTDGNDVYNINTDYEDPAKTPTGITRQYTLNVTHMILQGDGYKNVYGKVFNNSFPGPWLKACWGDDIEVTVTNFLQYNGTSIHWHGIRQLNSLQSDGVNGVTQCPITGQPSPDSYTYRFKAMQYGTSWYHSHYSLQYSDGVVGPLTLFGPSSAPYDEAIDPILMSDNLHTSAFSNFWREITPQGPQNPLGIPRMDNIIVNGIGLSNCTQAQKDSGICVDQPNRYNMTFERGKKYLLRLINTSTDTIFVFAIDNHNITVVGADFVPIKPYVTDSVLVAIGQRYHVIVEANPIDDNRPVADQNFWMRTIPAANCFNFAQATPDNRTGIVFYNDSDPSVVPNTTQGTYPTACSDEPYESLIPVVPWTIGRPSNPEDGSTFEVGLNTHELNATDPLPPRGNFTRWELGEQPLYINFSDPTILHVDQTPAATFAPNLVVVSELAESNADDAWVYLLISAANVPFVEPSDGRSIIPASHPIHLHGHDFAILAQESTPYWPGLASLKVDNPPRRDVALLPSGGYLIIAFKADNPGSWLLHCHIAWHASSGLGLQILERDGSIDVAPSDLEESQRVCNNWDIWFSNSSNWYVNDTFQEDSGI